jgi:hypothetical protein
LTLNISNNSGSSEKPAIATDIFNHIHIVWYDNTDIVAFSRILYTKWDGQYFAPIISLSPLRGGSWRPAIATDSLGQVHVVYGHDVYGNAEILYTKWNGSYWTKPINISKTTGISSHPSIIVDKLNRVHVVWMDDTLSSKVFDIYYTRFDGYNWSIPVNLTNNPGDSQNPALAVGMDNSIHLVWYESVDGVGDIFYMKDANE